MFYFLGGLLLWYCIIFVWKTKTGSPSVMSKKAQVAKLVKYMKPGMRVADMGAGDGEALLAMARAGAVWAEGWEIEPLVWLSAIDRIRKAKMKGKVKVHWGDMWSSDLSIYDLVYVYQLTRFAPKFVKKIKNEMKKGALVVANTYPLKGLKLWKKDGEILVYRI